MTTCGASRLLVPAFLVGLAVASVTGTDVYGWLAAGVTLAVLLMARTTRGRGRSCTAQPPAAPDASTGGREVDRPEELPAP